LFQVPRFRSRKADPRRFRLLPSWLTVHTNDDPSGSSEADGTVAPSASAGPAAPGLAIDLAKLSERLQAVRITGSTTSAPSLVFWSEGIARFFAQASSEMAVARLRNKIGNLLARADVERLTLSVPATGVRGFSIDMDFSKGSVSAWFGGLHWSFDTDEEAWVWLSRALLANYRLRAVSIGDQEREWYLEPVPPHDGETLATGNFGFLDPWRKKISTIRQNTHGFSH
jgi:hypothetical protein